MKPQPSTLSARTVQPKITSNIDAKINSILRSRNMEKLEKLVRDGHGHRLMGKYSSDPKIKTLLKAVPFYLARIDMLHEAVMKGQLRDLQVLLNTISSITALKPTPENLALSKDNAGIGLLHKAVFYDHWEIVAWLAQYFPCTVHARDKLGRIPLHYVNVTSEPERFWDLLVSAGSDINCEDINGKTPLYFLTNNSDIRLPSKMENCNKYESIAIKPSNIRIWIHDQDINRLQQVVLEGHGDKLKTETSNKPLIKKFLNGVPYIMATIRQIHEAAIKNDVHAIQKYSRSPISLTVLYGKDVNGVTPLHKASGIGNDEIVDYILSKCPQSVHITDNEGRTALHYAASFKQDGIYNKLIKSEANANIKDKSGNTPKCYLSKNNPINSELLHVLPFTPMLDVPPLFATDFDWSILTSNNKNDYDISSSNEGSAESAEKLSQDVTENKTRDEKISKLVNSNDTSNDKENVDTSESIQEYNESNAVININDDVEYGDFSPNNNDDDNDVPFESANEYIEEKEKTKLSNDDIKINTEDDADKDIIESAKTVTIENSPDNQSIVFGSELSDKTLSNLNTSDKSRNEFGSDVKTNNEQMINENQLTINKIESHVIDDMLQEGNLEKIADFIMQGHGEYLLNRQCDNEEIQEFLKNLPIYLKKIELIHYCCEIGNVEELQKYLDRRKYVIARENKTSLYLTPLHVAVMYNQSRIARYLGGRFPETFKTVDRLGQTPLHFAAMHPNGKFIYNMMLTLGADKTIKNDEGVSAEFLYQNPNENQYKKLMEIVNKSKNLPINYSNSTSYKNIETATKTNEKTDKDTTVLDLSNSLETSKLKISPSEDSHELFDTKEFKNTKNEFEPQIFPTDLSDHNDQLQSNNESDHNDQLQSNDEPLKKEIADEWPSEQETQHSENESLESELLQMSVKSQSSESHSSSIKSSSGKRNSIIDYDDTEMYRDQFQPIARDEYGQTEIHVAAAKTHNRNALFHMLQKVNINIAYRDEHYRTARDIAAFAELYENIQAIDEYTLHIVANDEIDKILQLIVDGYDHILDTETKENITDVATNRKLEKMLRILHTIPLFEKVRYNLHKAIREGNVLEVREIFFKCGKDAKLMAISKNDTFRCSLHIAVLCENKDIVKNIVKKYPETLYVGDNLERTPLHYAMALDSVEEISNILIHAGAKRTAKDLKGRQPSYYYINKTDIFRMRQEEIILNSGPIGQSKRYR